MVYKGKNRGLWFIVVSLVIITLLHYFTTTSKWDIHEFYRRLYYIPIIIGAFKFRLRGGVLTSLGVSLLYAPHLMIYLGEINIVVLNQILEIIMFIVVGTATGFLVESDYKKKNLLEVRIKQLTNLENYTQNILDSITNVFVTLNKNLKIQSINKEGRDIFNLSDSDIGKDLDFIFEEYDEVEQMLKKFLIDNKKYATIETKCFSNIKTSMYFKLYIYPLKNILGKIEGVVLVFEDISEIRKLESQVRRAEKLSAVGELASGIAHEIRNPLGIIKTISQTIKKDILDADIKEGIEIIINEVDRVNNVIKGLLDFAKPSIGEIKTTNIDLIIKNIILITYKYAQQHNVKINYQPDSSTIAMIDGEKLKQAFINIIFNSVQAMPSGGNIDIEMTTQKDWVKISFKDEGVGISSDKLEKIYEPFYTTKNTGTGLGLPITHRIIEEHQGYMEVRSIVGTGTTFDIYIPVVNSKE